MWLSISCLWCVAFLHTASLFLMLFSFTELLNLRSNTMFVSACISFVVCFLCVSQHIAIQCIFYEWKVCVAVFDDVDRVSTSEGVHLAWQRSHQSRSWVIQS